MSGFKNDNEEKKIEELNYISMDIIMHAGNSHNYMENAVDEAVKGNFKEAEEFIKKASDEIVKAHNAQTDVIQTSIRDNQNIMTLLFVHAQDTLMTIRSELKMVKHIIGLYGKIDKLEKDS